MAWQLDRLLLGTGLTPRSPRKAPMLGILTSHPIQYQAPVWKAIAERGNIPCRVFYLTDQGLTHQHDVGLDAALHGTSIYAAATITSFWGSRERRREASFPPASVGASAACFASAA